MSCSLSTLSNRTQGFKFDQLFTVNQFLNQTCPSTSDIFFPGTKWLTDATCHKITGTTSSITSWTPYPNDDIWTRIVTWKMPLFQLVAQFPRPPLGFAVESIAIVHLLGDPVDSMVSMLLTLAMCRSRATLAKEVCKAARIQPTDAEYDRTWKGLAIMLVSYDDCGKSEDVEGFCEEYLRLREHPDFEGDIRYVYEETSNCLAADRQTKTLPVFIAEALFIGGWLIALLKAAATDPAPTNWPNVEAQSIAISGMYLWVTSAVVVGSVIGASQTEASMPRLLQGFEYHLNDFREQPTMRRASASHREEILWCKTGQGRAIDGGMYSWRPKKWRDDMAAFDIASWSMVSFVIISIVVLLASFLTAALLSYFVPPKGPSCRHITETLMLAMWLTSFAIECVLERALQKRVFWVVFWKDLFFALGNIIIVGVVQWGLLNRCSCWTGWGTTGLHLPQLPDVKPELMDYIRHKAPWLTFMAILFQLMFCAAVAWNYWDAVRVFIQRDDGVPNWQWRDSSKERRNEAK